MDTPIEYRDGRHMSQAVRIGSDLLRQVAEIADKTRTMTKAKFPPRPMTLDELKAYKGVTISPLQASGILNCCPYSLNMAARDGDLGVRHVFCGRNLRIFRADLLDACGGKGDE